MSRPNIEETLTTCNSLLITSDIVEDEELTSVLLEVPYICKYTLDIEKKLSDAEATIAEQKRELAMLMERH